MLKIHSVYGLVCPIEGKVFYIGMTTNPENRLINHKSDPSCAPWAYCQDLKEQGLEPNMVYFGHFEDKTQARHLEARLTLAIPKLCNRPSISMPVREPIDWTNLSVECY